MAVSEHWRIVGFPDALPLAVGWGRRIHFGEINISHERTRSGWSMTRCAWDALESKPSSPSRGCGSVPFHQGFMGISGGFNGMVG